MQPEQRLVEIGEDLVVERLVFLVGAVGGVLLPQRVNVVYRRLGGLFLALLGLGILVLKIDFHRHERAVLVQHGAQGVRLEIFHALVVDMHDDVGAVTFALGVAHLILALFVADPLDGGCAAVGAADDLDLVADHERRIEAESEVPDDAVGSALALVLLDELHRA